MSKSGFSVLSDSWNNKSQHFKTRFVETNEFNEEIESGTRLTIYKKHFSHGTMKPCKGFRKRYDKFCKFKRKQFDLNDLNMSLYDDLRLTSLRKTTQLTR